MSKETSPKDKEVLAVSDISLDSILKRQLQTLQRVTKHIANSSLVGPLTKDEIQSLATCIRLTMDLKEKENEILDRMSDEDLANLTDSDE